MELRPFLAGVGIGLLFCLVFILTFQYISDTEQIKENVERTEWVELQYASLAEHASKPAFAFSLRFPQTEEKYVTQVELYEQRPPREIIFLEGPWVGAKNLDELKNLLRKHAGRYALEFRVKDQVDLAPSSFGRVIVLPSGVWPQEFDLHSQTSKEDCILYLGLQKNMTLKKDGTVVEGGFEQYFFEEREGRQTTIGSVGEVEGRSVFGVSTTIDEIQNVEKFAIDAFEFAHSKCQSPVLEEQYEQYQKFEIVELDKRYPQIWAKISVYKKGEVQRVWLRKVEWESGTIEGVGEVLDGKEYVFRAQIWPRLAPEHKIKYYAIILTPDNKVYSKKELGEILSPTMTQIQKRGYVSTFSIDTWPNSDFAQIEIQDQYAQVYARALVELPKYSVERLDDVAKSRRFGIYKGPTRIQRDYVEVRKTGAERWTRVALMGGRFDIMSDWEQKNKIEIKIGDEVISKEWVEEPKGLVRAAQTAVWIVSLTALIYLYVRRGRDQKYFIEVEHIASAPSKQLHLSRDEILKQITGAMSVEQICEKIEKKYISQKEALRPSSLKEALNKFVQEKKLVRHGQYYANRNQCTQKEIRKISMEEFVKERLLEQGISLRKKGWAHIDSEGRMWAIYPQGEHEEFINKAAKNIPHFIIFEDMEQKIEFLEITNRMLQNQDAKILLALQTQKIKLLSKENILEFAKYD